MPRARTDVRALMAAGSALLLAGCVVKPPASCVSIEPAIVGARLSVAQLQCAADRGDQRAALELGRAYEDGEGVSRDLARAAELYRMAAQPRAGSTQVYAPPVRLGGTGTILTLPADGTRGEAEAQYRLAMLLLDRQVVATNAREATTMLALAASQGYAPAASALRELAARHAP